MFAIKVFAEFFVRRNLAVAGDTATTVSNIAGNELLFRLAAAT
jgi:hypothetical protein